jgi:phosphatidylglycerophosphatase C
MRTVAAFDFDGTLTRRDTFVPFLASLVGRARLLAALAAESPALTRVAVGRLDRDAAKERLVTRVLAGWRHDELTDAGHAYGRMLARDAITAPMRARLDWHRREGHEIVVVSASLDVYVAAAAEQLGIDRALCTRLEVDSAGRCTGRLLGGNCRGPEKAKRLQAHVAATGGCVAWAYGDSRGDAEMLALAANAVRVRRGRAPARAFVAPR